MWGVGLLALVTLSIINYILNYKTLLQQCIIEYFLLYSEFNFDPPAMRLCPDEPSINQFDFLETGDLLQTE